VRKILPYKEPVRCQWTTESEIIK